MHLEELQARSGYNSLSTVRCPSPHWSGQASFLCLVCGSPSRAILVHVAAGCRRLCGWREDQVAARIAMRGKPLDGFALALGKNERSSIFVQPHILSTSGLVRLFYIACHFPTAIDNANAHSRPPVCVPTSEMLLTFSHMASGADRLTPTSGLLGLLISTIKCLICFDLNIEPP